MTVGTIQREGAVGILRMFYTNGCCTPYNSNDLHAGHQHLRDYVSTIAYLLLFACLLVPVTEAWRNELQNLTQLLVGEEQPQQPKPCLPKEPEKPRTLYSAETGRLIPPPSRAMSRAASRRASRHGNRDQFLHHIAAEPDMESMVCFIHNELLQ